LRNWLLTAIPIGVAIIAALVVSVSARQPQPPIEIRTIEPQPTPVVAMYVHVDGAVAAPGVYSLPTGARIFEAIEAAGGSTEEADTRELNLAAKVTDGQKLVIPIRRVGSAESVAAPPPQPASAAPPPSAASNSPTISINSATKRMLESLPGIGPVTADKILLRRTATGPFTRIEQLRDERIVNASTYERIKALISVD